MATPPPGPLLSVSCSPGPADRCRVGLIAGILGYFAYGGIAIATLVGGGGAGAALTLVHNLLDRR